jgi:hypothetical protein
MADVVTNNQIVGLMQSMNNIGVISMQYADGIPLFLENDLNTAINLKWILSCFEQLSGMHINFHKCSLISINI